MVLFLDSNGGSPAEASIMIGLPDDRSNQGQIPVLAFVRGQAESAGYQIAAYATSKYVTRFSSLGLIGVNVTHPKGELLQNVIVASSSKRKYRTPGSGHLIAEDVRG